MSTGESKDSWPPLISETKREIKYLNTPGTGYVQNTATILDEGQVFSSEGGIM